MSKQDKKNERHKYKPQKVTQVHDVTLNWIHSQKRYQLNFVSLLLSVSIEVTHLSSSSSYVRGSSSES